MKAVFISDTHTRHEQVVLPQAMFSSTAGTSVAKARSRRRKTSSTGSRCSRFSTRSSLPAITIVAPRSRQPAFVASFPRAVVYLENEGVEIEGLRIWGSPITPWFWDFAFNRGRGAEIDRYWQQIPTGLDILLTHGPPQGVLDLTTRGDDAGCADLRNRVLLTKPRFHLFGHIHEAYGQTVLGETECYNGSVVDEYYNVVMPPSSSTSERPANS